jgi:DNA-binding transcriptional MerR regulator
VEPVSKGPEAFRTISEVAEDLDLPQHVLRFWETRFTQIRPMKRGGGRRYYRPDDVDLLRGIRSLLYGEGYTIRGVQRILKEQGPRFVVGAGRGDLSGLTAGGEDDRGEDDIADREDDDLPIAPRRAVRPPAATESAEEEASGDQSDTDDEVIDAEADAAEEDDEPAAAMEPAFDPREFRPRPPANGSIYAKPPSSEFRASQSQAPHQAAMRGLAGDDVRRLQATLGELLELKRLLDQARG